MTAHDPRGVLDALPVSVARFDRQFRIAYANRRFCQTLDRPPEQIVGRTCGELGMPADEWDRWHGFLRQTFASDQPGEFEYLFTQPDGTERLVEIRTVPEADATGFIHTVLILVFRIEEVRRLRIALQAQEELFRAFMDRIPAIAWMRDADSRYVYLNKSYRDRYGVVANDRIGRMPEEVWPPDVAAQFRANDRRVLATDRPAQLIEHAPDPDGSPRVWLNLKFPFTGPTGRMFIGGVGMDVTDQRRMEAKLARAQKLESLGLLAAGAAHDFSNLVTIIRGNVDLARPDVPAGSDAADALRSIADAADRAADLCRQMLAFSGRRSDDIQAVDLPTVIRETARLARPLFPHTVGVMYDLPADLPAARGDAIQLRQVVLNLLTNAAEAIGPKGGTIRVAAGTDAMPEADGDGIFPTPDPDAGDRVWLEVADDGPGMSDATQARIFDPFYTTKPTGRGLGLAAVQGIVRSHGGRIHVHSEVGQGTTFRVVLPTFVRSQSAVETVS